MDRKATVRAAWTGAIAGVVATLLSLATLTYTIWTAHNVAKENILIDTGSQDCLVQLTDPVDAILYSRVLWVYYPLVVSNNGSKNISIVKNDISNLYIANNQVVSSSYSVGKEEKILYSASLSTMELPAIIEPGNAIRLYARVGLPITQKDYELIEGKYNESINNISTILYSLRKEKGEIQQQVTTESPSYNNEHWEWLLTFVTSTGNEVQYQLSVRNVLNIYQWPSIPIEPYRPFTGGSRE